MSLPQIASRATGCLSQARSGARRCARNNGLSSIVEKNSKMGLIRTQTVAGGVKSMTKVSQRYIALYRATHMPWAAYELTNQPELAKECEERVLAAYAANEVEELKMHFHRYRSIGVLPTTETWHKFLLTCYKAGDYHEIQSLFHTLISFGVTPDVTAWNFLLDLLSKRGLVRKTEETYWAAMKELKGELDEFSMKAFLNCLMQEKRYLRAMVAVAGMYEYGYSVPEDVVATLEQFCLKYLQERPGGFETLVVPSEDAKRITDAANLDKITFGHENVLSCSDDLSPAGRDALLTWYAKRATDLTPKEAYIRVLDSALNSWHDGATEALGLDPVCLPALRSLVESNKLPVAPIVIDEAQTKQGTKQHTVGTYTTPDGLRRSLLITSLPDGSLSHHITDEAGKQISNEEAQTFVDFLRTHGVTHFARSSL